MYELYFPLRFVVVLFEKKIPQYIHVLFLEKKERKKCQGTCLVLRDPSPGTCVKFGILPSVSLVDFCSKGT